MAISRYWRLVGIATPGNGALELSEARLYQGGALADASATLTASIAPASGALGDLRDGVATGVVAWPYASYSAPGFALVWDFGLGGGVETPSLRLGSGSSAGTFPVDLVCQSSDDSVFWTTRYSVTSAIYPGAMQLGPVPSGPSLVTVEDSFVDNTIAAYSAAATGVGATWVIEGGVLTAINSQSVGVQGTLVRSDLSVSTTRVEATMTQAFDAGLVIRHGTSGYYLLTITDSLAGSPNRCNIYKNISGGFTQLGSTIPIAFEQGTPHVFEFSAVGSTLTAKMDGTTLAVVSDSALTTGSVGLRNNVGKAVFQSMRWGEMRLTFLPIDVPPKARYRSSILPGDRLLPAVELPTTTAHGHLREIPFFDVFNGGIGLITGTVKEKSLPANVPLARKVWLMDEASGMVIRETWSDATTGTYEFRGIKQGVKYTVLAYDYTGAYRAVVADRIIPETTL